MLLCFFHLRYIVALITFAILKRCDVMNQWTEQDLKPSQRLVINFLFVTSEHSWSLFMKWLVSRQEGFQCVKVVLRFRTAQWLWRQWGWEGGAKTAPKNTDKEWREWGLEEYMGNVRDKRLENWIGHLHSWHAVFWLVRFTKVRVETEIEPFRRLDPACPCPLWWPGPNPSTWSRSSYSFNNCTCTTGT